MYIIITPAKNEEKNLPVVADAMIEQSLQPLIWVIVNDGSTDCTPEIILDLQNKYKWIKTLHLPPHPWDITYHYSYVCTQGFNYAVKLANDSNINYKYIGLLDADTVPEKRYFEKIISEFEENDNLGIASGEIFDMPNENIDWKQLTPQGHRSNKIFVGAEPWGTGRIWREKCFFETEGYHIEPAPDTISNIKAIYRGWEIKRCLHIHAIQLRTTSSEQGLWKGYQIRGNIAYYLHKHPLLVLLGVMYYSTYRPYYLGLAYLCGYLIEVFKQSPKIEDPEIKDYHWNNKIRENLHYFCKK